MTTFLCLQNGHIFVFTGLIKNMENIDQLAIIIGHEMAHAVMGHAVSQPFSSVFLSCSRNMGVSGNFPD